MVFKKYQVRILNSISIIKKTSLGFALRALLYERVNCARHRERDLYARANEM
jgi:hypothetical protein